MRRIAPTLFAVALTCLASCDRVSTEREAEEEAAPVDPRFAAPDLERLTDPATSPFVHYPVAWRYANTRTIGDEPPIESVVALTTTRDRAVVPGVGLLFKAVVEIADADDSSEYRSFVMLLTRDGLYMSEPNSFDGDLAESAAELVEGLRALGPSWPLPGHAGCESRIRDAELPFGSVRGVETVCEDLLTPAGYADVTTLWVDQVGFVLRESITRGDDGRPRVVRRDTLTGGDLVELAPRPPIAAVAP